MPHPTMTAATWPRMMTANGRYAWRQRSNAVHGVARFAFWSIFILNLTNATWLLVTYFRAIYGDQFMLAVYPVTVAIATALVLAFSRSRPHSPILIAGWGFWLVFFLGGFLGSEQATLSNIRHTVDVTLKPWFTLVVLPWLALRSITPDKVPKLLRATVLTITAGAILALVQLFIPGFMQELMVDMGRGSGFWVNPNNGGIMCALGLFLSFVHPFSRRSINWTMRALLIVGVGASFSRAAILALLAGWIVYGVTTGRFRSLLTSMLALALFVASMFVVLDAIDSVSPAQAIRLNYVRSFLAGNWASEDADNRTEIWKATLQSIIEKDGLIFGLGHGAMSGVADGLAPHNAYLNVLGNSGIIALLGLLVWLFVLAYQAFKCRRRETRAAMLSVVSLIAIIFIFDSSFLGPPSTGPIVACVALVVCYSQSQVSNPTRRQFLTGASGARVARPPFPGVIAPRQAP